MDALSTYVDDWQPPGRCRWRHARYGGNDRDSGERYVNWFPFDMDAWNRWTKKFGHTHRGVYVTLLAWYYSTGGPLPLDWPAIFRIAEAHGDPERTAVRDVMAAFFDCRETGWHNARADDEVLRYVRNGGDALRDRQSVTGVTLAASRDTPVKVLKGGAQRQQVYRDRKHEIVGRLRQLGAHAGMKMSAAELRALGENLGITFPEFKKNVTPRVTTDTRYHQEENVSVLSANAGEAGGGEGGAAPAEGAPAEKSGSFEALTPGGTLAGEVCKRMKQQGLFGVNPGHPKLLQLLADGATVDELVHTAAEAVASQKPFAWVLAVVRGRRDDMAREVKQPREGLRTGRGDVKTNRLQAWVPELVAKPQAPDFAYFDDQVPHVPAD